MKRSELVTLVRRFRLGVVASVSADGSPQAATVGLAISDDLEIVFDTDNGTRKLANITREPRVAVVVGADEVTVQIEGVADVVADDRLREVYFAAWPDGRERAKSPTITHVRIRPTWVRVSDYSNGPVIEEVQL
ncbi:MAG: pyridoxamine 5'-phosphate oxidase family protein [Kofleriaceae bacterium]